ncbi:MAG: very short patch repair endonuclease [Terriglobales bacterium]
MADVFSQKKRSWVMSRIGQRDTRPEIVARSYLHAEGFRFRLHASLPGKPDIVLPRFRTAIFINGCFWHHHARCPRATLPTTNRDFWEQKILRNVKRDRRVRKQLREMGWSVMTIWQCELRNIDERTACLGRLVRKLAKT